MAQFFIANGPSPTTAAQVAVTTGTAIKTLLQTQTGATVPAKIKRYGISFDGSAAATPIKVELLDTGTVAGNSRGGDVVLFLSGQFQRGSALTGQELQGQDPHAHENLLQSPQQRWVLGDCKFRIHLRCLRR